MLDFSSLRTLLLGPPIRSILAHLDPIASPSLRLYLPDSIPRRSAWRKTRTARRRAMWRKTIATSLTRKTPSRRTSSRVSRTGAKRTATGRSPRYRRLLSLSLFPDSGLVLGAPPRVSAISNLSEWISCEWLLNRSVFSFVLFVSIRILEKKKNSFQSLDTDGFLVKH